MYQYSEDSPVTDTAKLFVTGRSQAVRLPRAYRFEGEEVFIRRDPLTGDVVLSRKPESWQGFLDVAASAQVPSEFMRDREDPPAPERDSL
jgi:antitoxin VapB